MFTGIVEETGRVISLQPELDNLHITVSCSFADELKVDQSLAHNGVCLTVISVQPGQYTVTAISETLRRSNLGLLQVKDLINLERSMVLNGRIDGHIVQGHVDTSAVCLKAEDQQGSWLFTFEYDENPDYVTVPKGSVCVNGVSLTVVEAAKNSFSVAIIPYTYAHTNFNTLHPGSVVNLEFDVLGKYIARYLSMQRENNPG